MVDLGQKAARGELRIVSDVGDVVDRVAEHLALERLLQLLRVAGALLVVGEQRGVGGLFFDDLNCWDFETCFKYIQAVGNGYLNAILPIFEKHREQPYTEAQREFQLYRRGRYVEYNLVYDRGTLFGLKTGGRIESILISLPPKVRWEYNSKPLPGSAENQLLEVLHHPKAWL